MPHLLVVPGFLGPHGGFENYVDAVVTVALGAGYQVTVATDRPALGRTDVADAWVGRADLRSAEGEWRRTPTGRLTVGAALARDTARRRRRPSPDEQRTAGETRAIPAIEAYWSTGPGVELMSTADLVHLVGKPKPWVCEALRAAHRAGVPAAYAEVAQVTPEYAARPDLAGFSDVARLVDLAVCFYDEQADDLHDRFGYEGPAVRVEQWADGLEDALLDLPVTRGQDDSRIVVGSLSRLGPEKGLDTLVRGFAAAAAGNEGLHLRIAGTGSEGPATEALAAELGVADRVELVGFVEDRVALLSGVDVFVVSSIEEGGPITGVEAMAAARPVVSTAAGAMRERIRADVDGLRFEARDADTLAAHLTALADGGSGAARRAELGAAARQRYLERNHSSITIPALLDAWASLIT